MVGYLACKQKLGYIPEFGHNTTSMATHSGSSFFPGQIAANGGNILTVSTTASATQITQATAYWPKANQWVGAIVEVYKADKTAMRGRYTITASTSQVLTITSDASATSIISTDVGEIIAYAKTPQNTQTYFATGLHFTDEFNPVETEVEIHKYRDLTNKTREASLLFQGRKIVKGKMDGIVSQWRLLKYCIGKDTWSATTSPSNHEVHDITYNDELPSACFALHQDGTGSTTDFDRYASGMKVDRWEASFDMGGQWKLSIDWLGSKEEKTTHTIEWTANDVYAPMFSWNTELTYLSNTYARIENCKFGGSSNLTPKWYGNTTRPRYCYVIDEGDADYDFELKVTISDTRLFDEMIAYSSTSGLSTKDIVVTSTRTASTDLIQWTLLEAQIIGNPIPTMSKGKLTCTVKGTCQKIYATYRTPDSVIAHET